jgi:RNA polymerase sigma-70 factor (ECF subfamily)
MTASTETNTVMEFSEISDQYYDRVGKFVLSTVKDQWAAEDILQETFVRVRKNQESLKDPSKISSWIFRIAYNLCQDHFRQTKKSPLNESEEHDKPDTRKEIFVQKQMEQQQMGQCVQDQTDQLPESQRTVLFLFDIMEFSNQEISDILGISVENVKIRLHRARKKLKSLLEKACTFERDERNVLVCEPSKTNPS